MPEGGITCHPVEMSEDEYIGMTRIALTFWSCLRELVVRFRWGLHAYVLMETMRKLSMQCSESAQTRVVPTLCATRS